MSDQVDALLAVIRRLEAARIDDMISGSTAMNFYARPRMTRDIDIVIELEPAVVARLVDVLTSDFYIDEEMVTQAAHRRGMFNVIHDQSMVKVDFIVRKDDPYRETEFRRRRVMRLGATEIFVVAPEDLILSKLLWSEASGSEMQTDDVRNLLTTAALDESYLNDWAERLGLARRLRSLRS